MITGIDANATIDYVSEKDKGEPKTIWKLGLLDYKSFLNIGNLSSSPEKATEALIEAVRHGLKGAVNYSHEFKTNEDFLVSEDFIKTIPPMILIEIGGKIMKLSTLSDDETKNS